MCYLTVNPTAAVPVLYKALNKTKQSGNYSVAAKIALLG